MSTYQGLKEWWLYLLIAIVVFLFGLMLNYIVMKINEAHRDQRLRNLQSKSPAGQVIQVEETALATVPPRKISQGKLITIKPSVAKAMKTNLDDTKGKEVVLLSESLEEPSFLLGIAYKKPVNNAVIDLNQTEVIELTDVAQSAQLSEKSEFEVHASTLNELSSNTGQIVILNDVLQKDLVLSVVDENKTLVIDSGVIENKPQVCSKIILPDANNFTETHEEEPEKSKPDTSTLPESLRPKTDDLPVIATETCEHKGNEGET